MKRFLLPLLAAVALPTAVNAEISDKIHKRCKDVRDYMGCVQMMGGQKQNEYGEGTRKFVRSDGSLSIFNPLAVSAVEEKGEYGRYLTYRYFKIATDGKSYPWTAKADCEDYTVNWEGDNKGWVKIKNYKKLKGWYKEAGKEALDILNESCPQMDRLVKEEQSGTKEYYRYDITASGGGGGGFKSRNQFDYKEFKQNEKIRNLENRIELDKINRERGY